ncbi:hypothetical protein CEXT_213581 [Caerostris extrusa]|uniref:Uncharacterized protein n=1 Tax=Caerostris extrusa TaxID=172846 RepID=A0AAV4MD36_CAEEX|nr:hypothetical protein CEXT_213581 [Caerostris extrusa]
MTPGHAITDVFQKLIPAPSAFRMVAKGNEPMKPLKNVFQNLTAPSAFRMAGKGNEPMKPLGSDADLSYTLSRVVFRCEKGVVGLSIRNSKTELE